MRHLKKTKKLDRSSSARKALLKSLSGSFIELEKIITTKAKGRALAPHIERLITKAKTNNLASRRNILKFVTKPAAEKLISDIAVRYKERNGGYTRITKIGRRLNDSAEMVVVELVK